MLTSVYVENSAQLLGTNEPISTHFTIGNCLDSLRLSRSALVKEELIALLIIPGY
jgi:hypothetical protein